MQTKPTLPWLAGLWCAAQLLIAASAHATNDRSVAFFYGANPPVAVLSQFDRIIVEPDNIQPEQHRALKQHSGATFAYVSVGEIGPTRSWSNQLPSSATLGTNADWGSKVMDLAHPAWQKFFLQRVSNLVSRGYDGLFLDTMDSYQLYATTDEQRILQENGLSNLLYRIKRRHPDLRLISNRGFEVIDVIAPYLEAVAAESLYAGWDNAEQQYKAVPEADRQWLKNKLTSIKNKHGVDIIAIDYLPPSERSQARDVAVNIAKDGFIPWVANPSLDYIGIGALEVIPREVLMLYDTRSNGDIYGAIENAEVHTFLAMPLEYMGYVPVYYDMSRKSLPSEVLKGRYAGVAVWHREPSDIPGYEAWLKKQFAETVPVALFGELGIPSTAELDLAMGIKSAYTIDRHSLTPLKSDDMVGFESPIPRRMDTFAMAIQNDSIKNTSHLTFVDKDGIELDTVITGPWGGIALTPTVINLGVDQSVDWILDPFKFLKAALQLSDAPMPDITSENGNRLWFAHIDGDALPSWAELPGRRLGAEVLQDEILKTTDLPHTVSVVVSEINSINAYADRRDRMISTARSIFAMDNVELASHTYSHPFAWQDLRQGDLSGKYNLRLPGYRYNLEREIAGSVNYINNHLAPPDKTTKVLLWSGDAYPPKEALDLVNKYGLLNMNGGLTRITKAVPSVTAISANARIVGDRLQVYAPIMNENIYTNNWLGPFDGFREVLETFAMTEYPRRIKPANVYYHFYIGTKAASMRSLKEVYEWTDKQPVFPIFGSEYIVKVPHFRTAGVARHLDGRWKVSGLGSIKSLRILKPNVWPDLKSSRSIVGARKLHDGIYIHTNGADSLSFRTQSTRPRQPHLVAANASVERWQPIGNGKIGMRFSGHLPVTLELNGDKRYCALKHRNTVIRGQLTVDGNTQYKFQTKDTGDAVIDCQT